MISLSRKRFEKFATGVSYIYKEAAVEVYKLSF